MKTYQVLTSVTGLTVGQTITDEQLAKDHPGLNIEKLKKNGAIREAGSPAPPPDTPKIERVRGGFKQ